MNTAKPGSPTVREGCRAHFGARLHPALTTMRPLLSASKTQAALNASVPYADFASATQGTASSAWR